MNVEEQENNKTKQNSSGLLLWPMANGLERKGQMELVTVEGIFIDSIILMLSRA
jgi:hypothetical protein